MKERPILFSAPMVRAILAGQKTQTRRMVKPIGGDDGFVLQDCGSGWWPYRSDDGESAITRDGNETPHSCPYGQPGDRLWVREAWRHIEGGVMYDAAGGAIDAFEPETVYRADNEKRPGPWKPSIHMPRWASRITLEVTGVRVERLCDISEADATAEGTPNSLHLSGGRFANENFCHLWETINGEGSWSANPWVWVVKFARIKGP